MIEWLLWQYNNACKDIVIRLKLFGQSNYTLFYLRTELQCFHLRIFNGVVCIQR